MDCFGATAAAGSVEECFPLAALVSTMVVTSAARVENAAAAASATDAYTAVAPTLVLDSRIGLGAPGRIAAGGSFVLHIGGVALVPMGCERSRTERDRHESQRAGLRLSVGRRRP